MISVAWARGEIAKIERETRDYFVTATLKWREDKRNGRTGGRDPAWIELSARERARNDLDLATHVFAMAMAKNLPMGDPPAEIAYVLACVGTNVDYSPPIVAVEVWSSVD